MRKHYDQWEVPESICFNCDEPFDYIDLVHVHQGKRYCDKCRPDLTKVSDYKEPDHYHKHVIDTIKFLQEGFAPEVFTHFCIANVIKYIQRYQHKNGTEDLEKALDYCKRLIDWHKKNHS